MALDPVYQSGGFNGASWLPRQRSSERRLIWRGREDLTSLFDVLGGYGDFIEVV